MWEFTPGTKVTNVNFKRSNCKGKAEIRIQHYIHSRLEFYGRLDSCIVYRNAISKCPRTRGVAWIISLACLLPHKDEPIDDILYRVSLPCNDMQRYSPTVPPPPLFYIHSQA